MLQLTEDTRSEEQGRTIEVDVHVIIIKPVQLFGGGGEGERDREFGVCEAKGVVFIGLAMFSPLLTAIFETDKTTNLVK